LAGYDGTPVVLLQSSDLFWQTNLAPVAKRLMEKAGLVGATEWTPYIHLGKWRLVSAACRNASGFISVRPTCSGTSRRSEAPLLSEAIACA
jgi:hypothetical protein